MMRFEEHLPLDPECPDAPDEQAFFNDPMTVYSGCGDELWPLLEGKHRAECKRCIEYGVENIEVVGP